MKRVVGLLALLLVALLALPASAQETLGAGEGAPIVWPNFGGDPTNFNPLLISDGPSGDIARFIWPNFLKINVETGGYDAGAPDQIVDSWTISDDGTVYTFTLRDDYTWTDGTPITSADFLYAYDALASGALDSPLIGSVSSVASVEAPDAQTVVVTFTAADCSALSTIDDIPPVPAHVFNELFGTDYAAINESEFNTNPTVTAGEFEFSNFRTGEQVTLTPNQEFPDTEFGYVIPQGYIQRQLADQTLVVEEFLAGNLTIIDSVPEDREAELKDLAAAGEVNLIEGPASGWQFISFNVADPLNPQNAEDESGAPIDQGNHPIFGDVRVRQAFALSIDHAALNEGAFNGSGIPVASPILEASWAHNDTLSPWAYDPEAAMALLDEAGFVDDDNDPTTPRVATEDALYAEPGTTLSFALTSFSGNTSVESSAVLMQDQLAATGFDMTLDILEFQTMLEKFDGQNFDACLLYTSDAADE